jgi:ubiquinone/menaquinone biosynthesis C-methylase UbiE
MIERYIEKPTLQWQQMNITSLEFPDETFDVVVAKGLVDTILCGEGSTSNIAKMCQEISRVLKPKGCFFVVSYGVPDNRLSYLEKENSYDWTITTHTINKPSATPTPSPDDAKGFHYVYVCTKGG